LYYSRKARHRKRKKKVEKGKRHKKGKNKKKKKCIEEVSVVQMDTIVSSRDITCRSEEYVQ
jgi:hypothetical protein